MCRTPRRPRGPSSCSTARAWTSGSSAAKVNACKAPTIWQSYDITFQGPKCENGKKVAPATMTVLHNGILIHDNQAITVDNTTAGTGGDPCTPGPIMLQDHGNPVQYRS